MKKIAYFAMAAMLAVATPALANKHEKEADLPQRGPVGSDERFKAVDTNSDGKLSREEFLTDATTRAAELFARIDANSDGQATKEEMKANRERMQKAVRERMEEARKKAEESPKQ